MASVDEGCISVTWEIKNVMLLTVRKETQLCSPVWEVEHTNSKSTWWRLQAFHSDSRIKFNLLSPDQVSPPRDLLNSTKMSLVSSRGEVPLEREWMGYTIKKDVLGEDRQSILLNDTLTLICRIREKTMNRECHISSVLQRVDYLWKIKDFHSSSVTTVIKQNNFLLEAYLRKKSVQGTTCKVIVQAAYADNFFSFVDFSLSIDGGQGCVRKKTLGLTYVKWVCDFKKMKIFSENMDINLDINGIVALHKICQDPKLDSSSEIAKQKKVSEAVFRNSDDALVNDLLLLYREGALSDATLNTEGKSFSVHRSILAARSPVFRAMFEKDEMSEGRSGVVDIDDVDSETVDRMLVFLYGEKLENVNWEEASALFYAADKYAIHTLKQKCADILKTGLSLENVCDALVLADTHSDEHLMKLAVDFIYDHQKVVSSPKWEELEKRKPQLIIKITKELFLKKVNK